MRSSPPSAAGQIDEGARVVLVVTGSAPDPEQVDDGTAETIAPDAGAMLAALGLAS